MGSNLQSQKLRTSKRSNLQNQKLRISNFVMQLQFAEHLWSQIISPERTHLTRRRACQRECKPSYKLISSYKKLPSPACPRTTWRYYLTTANITLNLMLSSIPSLPTLPYSSANLSRPSNYSNIIIPLPFVKLRKTYNKTIVSLPSLIKLYILHVMYNIFNL